MTAMVKVECCSGYKINDRPLAFTIMERDYKRTFRVKEVLDSWYGEIADYFKVKADDDNIYLLKYDGSQDQWDLIFYQDPRKVHIVPSPPTVVKPPFQRDFGLSGQNNSILIH